MKVYEGSILTCDAQDHVYQFLVEDGGRIVHVGNELPARYASFPRVRLGSRALIPAFGDSHIHFASFATFHAGLTFVKAHDMTPDSLICQLKSAEQTIFRKLYAGMLSKKLYRLYEYR